MHNTWDVLRWAWAAVTIIYCVLAIVGDRRLRGAARKRNRNILTGIVFLVASRIAIERIFGGGLVYRFAVMIVGIVAGVAALIVMKMLTANQGGYEVEESEVESEQRIQTLKLS